MKFILSVSFLAFLFSMAVRAEVTITDGNYELMGFMSSGDCPQSVEAATINNHIHFTKTGESEAFEVFSNFATGLMSKELQDDLCFFETTFSTEVFILNYYNITQCDSQSPLESYYIKKVFANGDYFFIESLDNKDWFIYTCHYTRR